MIETLISLFAELPSEIEITLNKSETSLPLNSETKYGVRGFDTLSKYHPIPVLSTSSLALCKSNKVVFNPLILPSYILYLISYNKFPRQIMESHYLV